MAFLPTNSRDQRAAIYAALSLVIAVVYYMYMWAPIHDDLVVRQARLDTATIVVQRAKSDLAQGTTKELQVQAEQLQALMAVMRTLVPTGNEVPALLDQVSTAARRVGIDISDVQPLPILESDTYDAHRYRMSVRGNYDQIGVFLSNIGSLERIVTPINVTLVPLNPGQKPTKGRMQPLDARFEIAAYVERLRPPRGGAKDAAKGVSIKAGAGGGQ